MSSPAAVCQRCRHTLLPDREVVNPFSLVHRGLCAGCGQQEERRLLDEAIARADESLRRMGSP